MHTFSGKVKVIRKSLEFIFFDFLLKVPSHQNIFKNAKEKFNVPSF